MGLSAQNNLAFHRALHKPWAGSETDVVSWNMAGTEFQIVGKKRQKVAGLCRCVLEHVREAETLIMRPVAHVCNPSYLGG
jgi:hypothetical protein